MPNPYGDSPAATEPTTNPYGDTPVNEGVVDYAPGPDQTDQFKGANLPMVSSEEIMKGFVNNTLSEDAMKAGLELQKRGKLAEGMAPYLESLKTSRLVKDIGALDKPAKPEALSISEMITGKARETEATRTLPEFRETGPVQEPELSSEAVGLSAGLMFSLSNQDAMDVIKNAIPEAEFIKDEKGNIIVEVDGQLSVLNKPGFSKQDAVKSITQFLSFLPAGRAVSLGKGILAKVGIGALATGATEAGIQEIEQASGVTKERDPLRVATSAALGGGAEAIGPAYRGFKEARKAKALEKAGEGITDVPESIRTAKEAIEGVKEFTGVDVPLYKPQQTLVPSDVKLQRFLPQLDATSQKAAASMSKQNVKVSEAVENAVESLTSKEVINAPEDLRTAASRAIKGKKLIRKELSSPLFNAAKNETVDVSNVVKLIDDEMKPFLGKSNIKTQLEKIKTNIVKEEGEITIGELQKSKAAIDDILSVNTGDTALKGDSKRIVTKIKEELLTAMDGAGAKTPDEAVELRGKVKALMDRVQKGEAVTPEEIAELPIYGQARIKFAQASPEVVALEKGLIGKLSDARELSKINYSQVEQIADRLFDPKLRPRTIENAKTVLDGVDPEIFPQILKFKLLDNLAKIKPGGSGTIENVASKTRNALFGNAKQKRALMAGMSVEQKRNFKYLDTMLDRAAVGRAEGSPTASFQELMKNISSVPMFLQKLFTVNVGEIKNIGKQGALDSRLKSLAKMVYDDSWASELARVRKMNPNTAAAAKALAQLIDNVGNKEQ